MFADTLQPSNVQLALLETLETTALKRQNEQNAVCWYLLSSAEADTVHFVDSANGSLKRLNLQNKSVDDVIYRSDSPNLLRAALFVEFASEMKALLVAELRPHIAAQIMFFSLLALLFEANTRMWISNQRIPLDTSARELDYSSFVSISAMHAKKVLCSVSKTSQLEVLSVDPSGKCYRQQPIRLGFIHSSFTTGRSENTELLLIRLLVWGELRLLEVAETPESLSLRLLRVIRVPASAPRLLWRAELVFAAEWDEKSDTQEVNVFHVSGGGLRVQHCGTPIAHADNLKIGCWCTVGEKIVLSDDKSKKILVYQLTS